LSGDKRSQDSIHAKPAWWGTGGFAPKKSEPRSMSYGLLNHTPAIYVGHIIGLVMNLQMVNGILMNAGWTY